MKVSFMTWACPDWSLAQILTGAIRYGYDSVEPRVEADHAHGIELDTTKKERKAIREQFENCGVGISALATSRRYAIASDHELAESIELTQRYVDLAADLGCEHLRVFGGGTPEGMDFADAKKVVAESLRACADHAAERKVHLCLETHDSYSLSGDCLETVLMANHPSVAICWDILHPCRQGESIATAFENVRNHVRHCHVHDARLGEEPGSYQMALMGEGDVPHDEAVKLLASIKFEGALSGEWIKAFDADEILPHDATVLRQYIAEAEKGTEPFST